MLSLRFGLCALLLLAFACTDDKKNDAASPTPPDEKKSAPVTPREIVFDQVSSLGYAYGDYFNGYKSYRADLTQNSITGTWDRQDMSGLLRATSTIQLGEAEVQELAKLVADLNRSMVTVDKSQCGIIADGPTVSLFVTNKLTAEEIQIAEDVDVSGVCADEYVADKSLEPFFQFFEKLLPQPEDASAYQPIN